MTDISDANLPRGWFDPNAAVLEITMPPKNRLSDAQVQLLAAWQGIEPQESALDNVGLLLSLPILVGAVALAAVLWALGLTILALAAFGGAAWRYLKDIDYRALARNAPDAAAVAFLVVGVAIEYGVRWCLHRIYLRLLSWQVLTVVSIEELPPPVKALLHIRVEEPEINLVLDFSHPEPVTAAAICWSWTRAR